MNKEVVMIIKKSAINEVFEELVDVVIDNKLLVRICTDEEFDLMLKIADSSKGLIENGMVEER